MKIFFIKKTTDQFFLTEKACGTLISKEINNITHFLLLKTHIH